MVELRQALKIHDPASTAIVFGLFETGLAVIRSLGRKGIKIIGVDHKKDIGWYSRYVRPFLCPHPVEDRTAFIQWLLDSFKQSNSGFPAFITGDGFVQVLSDERDIFKGKLRLNLAPDRLLSIVADKYSQYTMVREAGIALPKTWLLEDSESLKQFENHIIWPLILKGRDVNSWRAVYGGSVKGFTVKNFGEILAFAAKAMEARVPVIAQEIIQGPDSNHFKYCAYVGKNGKTLAELCLRKIRQWPVRFGVGAVVESIHDRELLETGRKLFSALGYRGVGSAEFKRDARDGQLKLIELNTRYWQQNALAEACGVNFAWINYQDLLGRAPQAVVSYAVGIKWVNRYNDLSSFLTYHREGTLSLVEWRKSLRGKKVYADFSWDDPIPALYEIGFGKKLFNIPSFIWKRIFT